MAEFTEVVKQRRRMCDSHKGCSMCPMDIEPWSGCIDRMLKNPQQAEEIVMKWAKEHPVQTNEDKFEEVFGFRPHIPRCPKLDSVTCKGDCKLCVHNDWWAQEYKAPTEGGR